MPARITLRPEAALVPANSLKTHQSFSGTPIDAAAWPQSQWWTAYGDPQLDDLIDEALAGNPGLRIAEARTRAALAQVAAMDSSRYPSAGLSGQAARGRFSEHGLFPPPLAGNWGTIAQLTATPVLERGLLGQESRGVRERSRRRARGPKWIPRPRD